MFHLASVTDKKTQLIFPSTTLDIKVIEKSVLFVLQGAMQDVKLIFNRNIDWYTNVRRCINLEITQSTNSEFESSYGL